MSLVCLLTGTVVNLTLSYNTTGGLVCHCTSECDSNLECLGSSGCTSGWSGTTCQRYNQALGKDTRQSSTINDCVWADNADKIDACGLKNSSLAVDGKRSTNYWSGTCTMTDVNQKQAWWSVNLGQIHQIYYIKIYSPITNKQRIKGFTVSVDGDLCYTSPPYNTPVPPISIHCTRPMIGSNITIRAHQEQFILNLCEVEVYECADGVFGERCSSLCNCKNPDEVCDKLTGQCQSGCVDGYIGDGCQTKCVDGKFGAGCNSSCNCMYSEVCNKKTGHCNSGCSAGFTGTGCQEPCPNGHYGFNCSEVCGHCRGGGTYCNHVDGKCTYRCESNWTGDQCKECEDRKFGVRCSYSCKCKNPDEVCNKTTGHCSSGCSDGYTGNGCQTRCQRGFYGSRCSKKCGHCAGWEINCDHVNGTCKNGCRGNWDGGQCKDCVYYRFGPNCTKTCKCRNPTEVCDKTTGQCAATGCREGWRGRNCLTHCGDGTYGYNCSGTCGRCVDGEVCNKTDGTCFAGCEPGFLEPFCQDCRDGYYGAECRRCGQCLNNSPCDKQTGQCAEGCQPGLEGDNCHEACAPGKYGANCALNCSRGCSNGTCDPVSGVCAECIEGWELDPTNTTRCILGLAKKRLSGVFNKDDFPLNLSLYLIVPVPVIFILTSVWVYRH